MLRILKLLLPALIPAWNFFDVIAPSPRIQYTLLNAENGEASEWCEFRPRPERVSFFQMLGRMLWNPRWNETLFMISCAERLMEFPTQHSEDEILQRIAADLLRDNACTVEGEYLQFRLLVVQREGAQLRQEFVYESHIYSLSGQSTLKDAV